jgi:hypothetical protein
MSFIIIEKITDTLPMDVYLLGLTYKMGSTITEI